MRYDYPKYKISIIVPVFHMEQFLAECLQSILHQTHSNIEIIVVDDGSDGNALEIIQQFDDSRIIYIKHDKNRGLFQARVTGVARATGNFIGFVDCDDTVGIDYFRLLLMRCIECGADVAIGQSVHCAEDGRKSVVSLQETVFSFDSLKSDEVRREYFEQAGCCPAWHNIWNKLYKKELFDKCLPVFETLKERVVMGEDIIFSTLLLVHARKVVVARRAVYFYHQHSESTTGSALLNKEKVIDNFKILKIVFDFVDNYLVGFPRYIRDGFQKMRQRQGLVWKKIYLDNNGGVADERLKAALLDYCGEIPAGLSDGTFLGLFSHPWGDGLEKIKNVITHGRHLYISFDIFDTLVARPFADPRQLFCMLDEVFEMYMDTGICFHTIREQGEEGARLKAKEEHPEWEDITLREIYDYISRTYRIPFEICMKLMQAEEDLEVEFAFPRPGIKELYEVAVLSGKEVILISDMYLSKPALEKILKKCGYMGYNYIFVSSEERKLKNTGLLYETAMEKLNVTSEFILHIGDNQISDIKIAQEKYIDAFYIPKSMVLFENKACNYPTGNRSKMTQVAGGTMVDFRKVLNSMGTGVLSAIVADRFYEDPFVVYDADTNFNSNPYLFGYYLVGMHLIGIVRWIHDAVAPKKVKRLLFTSRDGWLIMKAYEIYRKYYPQLPEGKYIYVSRKSVLPATVQTVTDLFDLPIQVDQYTPAMLIRLLDFCAKKIGDKEKKGLMERAPAPVDVPFANQYQYQRFIEYFIEHWYDADKHRESYETARLYFGQIKEGDMIFDMGYSGRIQIAINRLAGHRVDALFIHTDQNRYVDAIRKSGFDIESFYNFAPMMPDLLREHVLSDFAPACIGYRRRGVTAAPIFEQSEKNYEDKFIIRAIHRGAIDMVKRTFDIFKGKLDRIPLKPLELSMPFEGWLACSTASDRAFFKCSWFEDEVYSGNPSNNIENYLTQQYEVVIPSTKNLPVENY